MSEEMFKLHGGWCKLLRYRQSGATVGQRDLYLITPTGDKLRSTRELCQYVVDKNLFEAVDPELINFEKPDLLNVNRTKSKQTNEFIKFIQSRGAVIPSYFSTTTEENKQNKPIKLTFNTRDIGMVKCDNCRILSADFIKIQNGQFHCQDCICSDDPYGTLERFYLQNRILPLKEQLERLQKQTGLTYDSIIDWFTKTFEEQSSPNRVKFESKPDVKHELLNAALASDTSQEEDVLPDLEVDLPVFKTEPGDSSQEELPDLEDDLPFFKTQPADSSQEELPDLDDDYDYDHVWSELPVLKSEPADTTQEELPDLDDD
jgi:hypothetical protein